MGVGKQSKEETLGHESPPSQAASVSTSDSQHAFSLASTTGSVTVTATITKVSENEVLYIDA